MAGFNRRLDKAWHFPTQARVDLERKLRQYQATTTIAALTKAVQAYHATQSSDRSLAKEARRIRAWLLALSKQLETTRTQLQRLRPDDAESLRLADDSLLREQGRAYLDHWLAVPAARREREHDR